MQGVVSPADPSLGPEVLQAQMEDANAKLIICCAATLKKVRKARDLTAKEIPILIMDVVDNMDLNVGQEKILSSLIKVIESFDFLHTKITAYYNDMTNWQLVTLTTQVRAYPTRKI